MSKQSNQWKSICHIDDLVENSGVCALINETEQVAIFNVPTLPERVFAIGNYDPLGKANVLYRGIVGCHQGEPVVASPLYKEKYSLRTGQCLQQEQKVPSYSVRIQNDLVQVLV